MKNSIRNWNYSAGNGNKKIGMVRKTSGILKISENRQIFSRGEKCTSSRAIKEMQ
jgi:hypothetical protein